MKGMAKRRQRIVVALLLVLVAACNDGSGGGGDDGGGGSANDPLVNGPTRGATTTYWRSASDAGCILTHNGTCFGELSFALAADGTADWSSGLYGCCGAGTWTRLGPTAILLNGPPFGSLNISNVSGGLTDGFFVGDASGYSNIRFTVQGGAVPNTCESTRYGATCSSQGCKGMCFDPTSPTTCGDTELPVNCTTKVADATNVTCTNGACAYGSCVTDYLDCDGTAANGCEVSVQQRESAMHAMGVTCTSSGYDYNACDAGYLDCDGDRSNGCEASTASLAHAHSFVCASGSVAFTCDTGYDNCDSNPGNGCEHDVSTDVANCGSCGNACTPGANQTVTCTAGSCDAPTCDLGYDDCDSNPANGCEATLATDPQNCGTCGHVCVASGCTAGTCVAHTLQLAGGHASVPGSADTNNRTTYTLEGWVITDTMSTTYQGMLSQDNGTCCTHRMLITPDLRPLINAGAHNDVILSFVFQLNRWYHWAMTCSGGTATIWIDGVNQGSTTCYDPGDMSTASVWIGTGEGGTNVPLHGRIAEVRISNVVRYTTAFTPQKRFTADANTMLLLHFDEGTGTTAADSSGKGHTATLQGAASWGIDDRP
jgi:hypothetical protein